MSKRIGNYVGFSTFLEQGGGNKGIWNLIDQFYFRGKGEWKDFFATGGTITTAAGKTIHTFTSSGTFEVTIGFSDVDYLVVAGGGGGGGGGGGAGGFRTGSGFAVSPGPYSITVGGGGAFGTTAVDVSGGTPSIFSTITSACGGFGNGYNVPGSTAGSGG